MNRIKSIFPSVCVLLLCSAYLSVSEESTAGSDGGKDASAVSSALSEAKAAIAEAEEAGAREYAAETYNAAQSELEKASTLSDDDAVEAMRLIESSKAKANAAREETSKKVFSLYVEPLNGAMTGLRLTRAAMYYPDEYSACTELSESARSSYKAKDYKKAAQYGENALAGIAALASKIASETERIRMLLDEMESILLGFEENGTYEREPKRTDLVIEKYFKGIESYAKYDIRGAYDSLAEAKKIAETDSKEIATMENPGFTNLASGSEGESREIRNYTVASIPGKRETLWDIADIVYGDPFFWPLVWRMNREAIPNPMFILPGQVLSIPPLPAE